MRMIFKTKNLCCANCANKIEKRLKKIKGVEIIVNFLTEKIIVNGDLEGKENLILFEIKNACKKTDKNIEVELIETVFD